MIGILGIHGAPCPLHLVLSGPAEFIPTSPDAMLQTSSGPSTQAIFLPVFDSALKAYEEKTGKDLSSNPLVHKIETCNSPDDIIAILRQQIPRSYKSQSSDDSLTRWLNPTVNVIKAFSANIGAAVVLVSPTQNKVTHLQCAH